MKKCFIGIGKCSYYYLYVVGVLILYFIKAMIVNEFDIEEIEKYKIIVLSKHNFIQIVYTNLGYIVFGSIIYFYIQRKKKNKILNEPKKQKSGEDLNNLLYNKDNNNENYNYPKETKRLIIIGIAFTIYQIFSTFSYTFGFDDFDLWTTDFIFVYFLMKYYFNLRLNKHQKYVLIYIIIFVNIFLFI